MNSIFQFIRRQSSIAAFLCLGFALLQSVRVGEGLWRGSGLHGYVFEPGKAHNGQLMSVWDALLNMRIALGLATFLACSRGQRGSSSTEMKRITIIGPGGVGKSTQARQMGAKTGLPVVHLELPPGPAPRHLDPDERLCGRAAARSLADAVAGTAISRTLLAPNTGGSNTG